MNCYLFATEPTGRQYQELIDFCCSLSAKLMFAVRDDHPSVQLVLDQLRDCYLGEERVHEWPGTVLLYGSEATIHWYAVGTTVRRAMKELASNLYSWVGHMPEDPCFFRQDGSRLLVTISHEHESYLVLAEPEHASMQRLYPSLASLLTDEGSVE